MPARVKMAVGCLAFVFASCASSEAAPAEGSPADADSAPAISSGKTVQTELEYLTSRQSADPRKASPSDKSDVVVADKVPAQERVVAPRAARNSSKRAASVTATSVPSGKGRDVSASLSTERAERSSSRNRKNAHRGSKWSLAFLFSGLRDAIISSRVQYLPLLGSAPVRFKDSAEFDRTKIIGFRQYDEQMEEVSFKNKPEVKAGEDDVASKSASGGSGDGSKPGASATVAGGTMLEAVDAAVAAQNAALKSGGAGQAVDVTSTSVRSDSRVGTSGSASSPNVDYAPVNSAMVMKYFDNGTQGPEVKVGMPFVMPYQNEQPLIMDSNAKYSQTDGGTKPGTPAK